MTLVDDRLDRRLILIIPPPLKPTEQEVKVTIDSLINKAWDIKTSRLVASDRVPSCVVIDGDQGFAFGVSEKKDQMLVVQIDSPAEADVFRRLWDCGESLRFSYGHTLDVDERELAVVSEAYWNDLIKRLAQNPDLLYELNSRKFEELVAELFNRDGLEVKLTPARKDGGYDILARANTELGKHLYLVECKRYAEHKPVGVAIVRALYGIVTAEDATSGLIVTTSRFTKGALQFAGEFEYRMTLKDKNNIVAWLTRHSVG